MLTPFKYLRNRYFLATDLILLPVAVYLSYVLRLDTFDPASQWWPGMLWLAGCVIPVTVFVFLRAGICADAPARWCSRSVMGIRPRAFE